MLHFSDDCLSFNAPAAKQLPCDWHKEAGANEAHDITPKAPPKWKYVPPWQWLSQPCTYSKHHSVAATICQRMKSHHITINIEEPLASCHVDCCLGMKDWNWYLALRIVGFSRVGDRFSGCWDATNLERVLQRRGKRHTPVALMLLRLLLVSCGLLRVKWRGHHGVACSGCCFERSLKVM
jgi:hypothetical protein